MSRIRKAATVALVTGMVLFGQHLFAQGYSSSPSRGLETIANTSRRGPPKGWTFAGNATKDYFTFTDVAEGLPIGSRCSVIEALHFSTSTHIGPPIRPASNRSSSFATVMQAISAESYRGKRLRFSAQLSTTEVVGQAGLWMRIDGANGKVLSFDDMASRPVSGTTPWQGYEVVLDVPVDSAAIQFGYLLAGGGRVKAAQFRLEPVDANTPTTATGVPRTNDVLSKVPSNLELRL